MSHIEHGFMCIDKETGCSQNPFSVPEIGRNLFPLSRLKREREQQVFVDFSDFSSRSTTDGDIDNKARKLGRM